MTSCFVGKIFPFVVLAKLMAMAGGISEHMLTSWSSFCLKNVSSFSAKATHIFFSEKNFSIFAYHSM